MAKEEVPINTQALAGRAGETTGVKNAETLSIDTKVTDFVTVQRSLEQIKAALEKLNSKQIGDGLTDELETEGVPGSIRIIKGKTNESYFEVKTAEGWRKPVVGDTLVKFKTIESNDKEPSPKSIEELEAEDAGDGGSKANNTIYDEKGGKFVIARPDFDSGWLRFLRNDAYVSADPPMQIVHNLETFPTLVKIYFAPSQGSGSLGAAVDESAITWFTDADTDMGAGYNHGMGTYVSKTEIRIHAADNETLVSSNFTISASDHRTAYRDGSVRVLLWK